MKQVLLLLISIVCIEAMGQDSLNFPPPNVAVFVYAMSYRKQFLDEMQNKIITDKELSSDQVKLMKPFIYEEIKETPWVPLLLQFFYSLFLALFILSRIQKSII
jgi:hypothetical protein